MDKVLSKYKHACGYIGEVVESDAKQPYRARIKGANGQIIFWTENYANKDSAETPLEKLGFVKQ